ncbi:MAG: hypothetical protein ABR905_08480 [Terracidiphilus sp.]|jgi:hypothetical protein
MFLSLGFREFLEDLVDRELQFGASAFDGFLRLRAEINIEAFEDAGCRWLGCDYLSNGLC